MTTQNADLHIVTGSDNNYVAGVMVLIASAVWHNPDARFTVLDMGISLENRKRLDDLSARLRVRIDRIVVDESRFSNLKVRRSHLNRSAYMRLLIPELLQQESRVVYMDSDMVVTGTLLPLAQLELNDFPIAAVACPSPDPRELASTGTQLGEYINSGLLVMNLRIWREHDLSTRCIESLTDLSCPKLCEDQSAINVVCRGSIIHLPARFNVYANTPTYRTPSDLPKDISVLHYVVNVKPWMWSVPFGEIWHFHARQIIDLMPAPRRSTLRQKMLRVEAHRRVVFGLVMGRKKHWLRRKVSRAIQEKIVAPYLLAQSAKSISDRQ